MMKFLKNELLGWKWYEVTWLSIAIGTIFGLSLYWHDTWYGIVSAISGVLCVILTGKGKLSAYVFGLVQVLFYSYISYNTALYGEVMLNMLYYLPLQFYGFYLWNKNMNDNTCEVKKIKMDWITRIDCLLGMMIGTFVYGAILTALKDPLPYVDSFTTVASVIAMWISCKRYAEQWLIWIAVDVLSVYMWWNRYCVGGDNIATLLMWIVFLFNAIYGAIKWNIDAKIKE